MGVWTSIRDPIDSLVPLAAYLEFVRNPQIGFVSVSLPLGDGIEHSVKLYHHSAV
jgi:hypothetical protein